MRLFVLSFLLLVAAGCRTLGIDVSHADTDKGYLNSGLRDLGHFYFFDTSNGELRELATINLTSRNQGRVFQRQVARDVRGVNVSGDVEEVVKARVSAEVAKSSYIELDNAFDESYQNTFADLSSEINRRDSAGEDPGFAWFLDEAVKPGSTIRYLLVYSTIRADSAKIGYNEQIVTGGEIDVPVGRGGSVSVNLTGLSEETFAGKAVPVLVDYHVIQAFKRDGLYKFRIDPSYSDRELSLLLRGEINPQPPTE